MRNDSLLETIRAHKLGLLIYDARRAAGKSIEAACAQAGIPEQDLQAYENGESIPSLPEIEALAFIFDVPIEHFWGRQALSEEKSEPSKTLNPKLMMVRQKMISSYLALKRSEMKLSLREVSQKSGLAEEIISEYENADRPVPLFDLAALAEALDLQMDELYDQRGVIAEWRKSRQSGVRQGSNSAASNLPPEIQDFISKPINRPFLELAMKFSEMPVDKLRTVAESILEITY